MSAEQGGNGMYDIRSAAPKLGISRNKLYQLVERREIGHFRVGGRIFFSAGDIAVYLAACRVEPIIINPASTKLNSATARPAQLKHLSLD